ncbi:hypothetical protein FH609_000350 [Streptomyces sp. 3MP-14]|uniref:DUF4276 family protein n=1 Tax=Streptomyces mimosae TaxID=2586635 RepID=A0A5N6AR95_9ACTN|nr:MULTISPECIES: hypothetical protein [Streptomyces]KAB8171134.1 hypothetical protein FH607_002120 [Streptomyces mimosae]KAB8179514.1 hypothetical protein FH609_000350 [Streptomyces sp. 3MP-14]
MLAALIRAAHPQLAEAVTLTEITDQVRLRKKSGPDLSRAVGALVRKAFGKARLKEGVLAGIVIHEDMDDCVGPSYDSVRRAVSAVLARESDGVSTVYALAAAESEAWLLLFPDAFPLHRPTWRIPKQLQGKDTGRRRNPKEDLMSVLKNPSFRESDGPEVLARGLANGLLDKPNGSNRSYNEFIGDLTRWEIPR